MNNNGKKGFEGLTSMVSDVGAALEKVAEVQRQTSDMKASVERANVSPSVPIQLSKSVGAPAPLPSQGSEPRTGGSTAIWVGGTFVVIAAVLIYVGSQEGSSSRGMATPQPIQASAASAQPASSPTNFASDHSAQTPTAPEVLVPRRRPEEMKPPVGNGVILSLAEIRYCTAERIRLDAGERITDLTNASAVATYNAAVTDYNGRCASFRYRGNDVVTARDEVERYRSEIESEALLRFGPAPAPANAIGLSTYSPTLQRNQYGAPAIPPAHFENPQGSYLRSEAVTSDDQSVEDSSEE